MHEHSHHLDDPSRISEIRDAVKGKAFLKRFYEAIYAQYLKVVESTPHLGSIVELGSGGGFAKEVIQDLITSDVIQYEGVDQIVDATAMPFKDESLRAILMLNVFHHIPDVAEFFSECERCLIPGGKVLIVDQNLGIISGPILKYAHHEGFDPNAKEWKFRSDGPLSSANGALAWIVFQRDRQNFEQKFPTLKINYYRPHAPLSYWLSGGLKKWTLVSGSMYPFVTGIDNILCKMIPSLGSFVSIELEKLPISHKGQKL